MFDELEQVERCLRIYKERLTEKRPAKTSGWAFEEWKRTQRVYRDKIAGLEKRKKELENARTN